MPEESLTLPRQQEPRRRPLVRRPASARGPAVVLDDTARAAKPSIYNRGYAASREQAMADFKARLSKAF